MYDDSLSLLAERKMYLNPRNYNIVFMGDSWVGAGGFTSNEIFQSAIEEAEKYKPLLVIHGGDLVFNGTTDNLNYFINFKNQIAPDLPLFVAVGNHDMDKSLTGDAAVANFEALIGPLHFTLNIPGYDLTLIALDSLYNHVYSHYGLTDAELLYLKNNLLQRYENTFVTMHVPPRTDEWIPDLGDDTFFTIGSDAFFTAVKKKITAALVSHIHAFQSTKYRHTRVLLSGGGGATLLKKEIFHILVVNISSDDDDSEYKFSLVPIGRD